MDIKVKQLLVRIFDKSLKIGWKMKVMLGLSIAFAVIYSLSNFFVMLFKDYTINYINTHINSTMLYFWKENLLFFFSANRSLYILCFICGIGMLYGCYLMWKGYKWGLLFYTLSKVFQILLPIIFLGHRMIAIGDIMIALLFLVFYYTYSFSHQMDKEERKYFQLQKDGQQEYEQNES